MIAWQACYRLSHLSTRNTCIFEGNTFKAQQLGDVIRAKIKAKGSNHPRTLEGLLCAVLSTIPVLSSASASAQLWKVGHDTPSLCLGLSAHTLLSCQSCPLQPPCLNPMFCERSNQSAVVSG